MRIACFCGCVYGADSELAQCPYCGETATLPRVTDREAMEAELAELLAAHEPTQEA